MLFRLLCVLALIAGVKSATLIPEAEIHTHLTAKKGIVAFYNVYAQGNDYNGIVQNQVSTVKGSGLLDKLDSVYYATMGNAGHDYDIGESDKYVHIAHYGDTGSELQTLKMLQQFCHANPSSKVLYFHDKGSFHHSYANAKFCAVLNCYVLNPNCIEALDSHDTCGWRISLTPHIHYSGNFWWARCQYINTLIDPMAPINNATFIEAAKSLNDCVGIDGRYFAESWIGTGPTLLPADCMNSTIDSSYVWGYRFPYAADAYCHGPEVPSGLPCQTASTYEKVEDFKNAINQMNGLMANPVCRDNRAEIQKLSMMMYGEAPHTYNEWMERLYHAIKLKEDTLLRFTDSTQVYIAKSGILHGIPNLKTFMTLGRDFDEVTTVYASDRPGYTIGEDLPSA